GEEAGASRSEAVQPRAQWDRRRHREWVGTRLGDRGDPGADGRRGGEGRSRSAGTDIADGAGLVLRTGEGDRRTSGARIELNGARARDRAAQSQRRGRTVRVIDLQNRRGGGTGREGDRTR